MNYILNKLEKYNPFFDEDTKILIFRKPIPARILFEIRYYIKIYKLEISDILIGV